MKQSTMRLALFATLLAACSVSAAPLVSGVSGDAVHGATITISGSGFGAKSPAGPVVWDTIDNQSAYSALSDGDPVPTTSGCPWTSSHDVTYCDSSPMRGRETAHYRTTTKGYVGWPAAMQPYRAADNKKVYANWWWRPATDPQTAGGSNKMIRVWDDGNGYGTRISWTTMHMTYDGNPSPSWGGWGGVAGAWNHEEFWVDADAQTIQAWTNGNLRHSVSDFVKDDIGVGLTVALVGFDPSISDYYSGMDVQMADIYVDVTQARVVLGNAATLSACTHTEIQIPTSWSGSSVTIGLNQGSFANGANAYLFVVDQDGAASEGYAIALGGPVPHHLTVTNGSGSGDYEEGQVVAIAANPPTSGKAFAAWMGDFAYVADRTAAQTTVTMPARDVSLVPAYVWVYRLTVNSGSGGGDYPAAAVVAIEADAAPTGQQFAAWAGDVSRVDDVSAAATTVTMPSSAVIVTATYSPVAAMQPGDLSGDGFVGQVDLDIVLANWGCGGEGGLPLLDPRADASGDGFVGQADLDIVLANWGQGTLR